VVTDTNLSGRITAPVPGASPVITAPTSTQYTSNTVVWYDLATHNGVTTFVSGVQYVAELNLIAAAEYSFAGVGAFTYNSLTAQKSFNTGNTITIAIIFPVAGINNDMVTDTDLTNKIPAPVTNEEPVFFIESPQYTGTVEWYDPQSPWRHLNSGSGFRDTSIYSHQAFITLTAKAGYTFSGVEDAFTYDGETVNLNDCNADGSIILLSIDFGCDQLVSLYDLSPYFDSPYIGEYPDKAFENEEYIGEIEWTSNKAMWTDNHEFEDGWDYTATVTLHVKRGYTFDEWSIANFDYPGDPDDPGDPGGEIVRWTSNPFSASEITLEIHFIAQVN
jgi:hypothetical protein